MRYVSAAVRCSRDSCSLRTSCEEVQELQARRETSFSDNRTWKVDGDLLKSTQSLLRNIDVLDIKQLLTQDRHSSSVHHISHRSTQGFHEVGDTAAG